jgi:hypothetical protein
MLEKERKLNADKDRYMDSTKRSDTEQRREGINKIGSSWGRSVFFVVISRF